MVCIYILQLQKGKYYVGKTTYPQFRLNSHFNNNGSEWTKKYKPIRVVKLQKDCDDYDEDKVTRQYMDKYGIENVRGGSFATVTLDASVLNILKRMSCGTNDRCFKCGEPGHFIKDCKYEEGGDNYDDEYDDESDDESDDEYDDENNYGEDNSHYVDVWCCQYCGKEFDTKKGCIFHENIHCSKRYKTSKRKTSKSKIINCFRCGRKGHYATTCYANTHIKGYYL